MITIAEAISDLLFVRDTVVVPGLGAFVKKPVSAAVNPVANYFTMPSSELAFDAQLREDNDLVINYISEKNDVPEDEAKRLMTMFVSDCFNSLKAGKNVALKDIGTLSFDWNNDLAFEPCNTLNYNADAFGLSDFSPVPVVQSKSKDEIKAEIEQQQKDKNTPVTVDEKAVHEEDEHHERHLGWLWILLGVLLMGIIVYGMYYFQIVDFNLGRWEDPPHKNVINTSSLHKNEEPPVAIHDTMPADVLKMDTLQMDTLKTDTLAVVPHDSLTTETQQDTPVPEANDSPVQEVEVAPTEPVAVETPQADIRIIAGCFSQEENAERMANTLRDKGYKYAFIEKRGSKWYVAFGRYATNEEATAALREIRSKGDDKAWILK